jgi:hypothetical protein
LEPVAADSSRSIRWEYHPVADVVDLVPQPVAGRAGELPSVSSGVCSRTRESAARLYARILAAVRRTVLIAILAALALAAPAQAAVLVHAPPKRLVCGDAITVGIWAQSWTTGSRWVRMKAIDRSTGTVWWHRKARASKRHWRYWTLPSGMDGQCGRTTIVYRGHGFTSTFHVRFKSEGV